MLTTLLTLYNLGKLEQQVTVLYLVEKSVLLFQAMVNCLNNIRNYMDQIVKSIATVEHSNIFTDLFLPNYGFIEALMSGQTIGCTNRYTKHW